MAEFQEVMRQWARMCNSVPGKNEYINLCSDKKSRYICPMKDCGLCNKSLSSQTNDDILIGEKIIMTWAAEHPEPVYPSFLEWLHKVLPNLNGQDDHGTILELVKTPIPADIAQKLGIKPKKK